MNMVSGFFNHFITGPDFGGFLRRNAYSHDEREYAK